MTEHKDSQPKPASVEDPENERSSWDLVGELIDLVAHRAPFLKKIEASKKAYAAITQQAEQLALGRTALAVSQEKSAQLSEELARMVVSVAAVIQHERDQLRTQLAALQYDKTELNAFAQSLYDQKMQEGKHGHYESMFHVIHKAIERVGRCALQYDEELPEPVGHLRMGPNQDFVTTKVASEIADSKWRRVYTADQVRQAMANDRAKQVPKWLPIETAPKDGRDILVRYGKWVFCVFADTENELNWTTFDGHDFNCLRREYATPTHWMPAPDPKEAI